VQFQKFKLAQNFVSLLDDYYTVDTTSKIGELWLL